MGHIAFFGTPNFSVPCLKAVHRFCRDFGHEIALVVTQMDQRAFRGQQLLPPPVKACALSLGIPVLQPQTLRKGTNDGDDFFARFIDYNIDLTVVVAYGKLISERLLRSSRCGFVNIHASLLPRFRGAAPIQRAIEAGDVKTGVCLMDMVKALDEGDIYACRETPILPSDTADTLFRRLSNLGATILYENLDGLLAGRLAKVAQKGDGVVYAPMVLKDEGVLNFAQPVRSISHKVQAFDPWPGSFGFIRGKRIKLFDSFFITDTTVHQSQPVGTIVAVGKFLGVKGLDGIVYFQAMQVEGKKALSIKDAILGFPIVVGDKIFSSL